jgi:cytochrome subunit of sulfide dehydrogenase
MKVRAASIVLAGLSQAVAAIVFAQPPAPAAPSFAAPNLTEGGVRSMAANCTPCHGPSGRPVPRSSVAALAGRNDIAEVMKAYKEGRREATLMHQIARGYSDAEIAALAGYFSRQPR